MDTITWDHGRQLWDLVGFLKESGALASSHLFRGQGNAEWQLIPALYRRHPHGVGFSGPLEDGYVIVEEWMLNAFFDQSALLLPAIKRSKVLDRVIAQHYGVPTQLLDWTIDPLIALYFAVSDQPQEDRDCALYYIYPSNGIDPAYLKDLPYKHGIGLIVPPVIDERIRVQKSRFTLQSFGSLVAKFEPLDVRPLKVSKAGEQMNDLDQVIAFGKIVIPAARKKQLHLQLLGLGVDPALVYPGLSGIGARIATHARLKDYGGDTRF